MTPKGYEVVFKLFTELIERKYPKLNPANMPFGIPDFQLLKKGHNSATIAQTEAAYRTYWSA
jgi:hypothetical protein